MKLCSDKAAYEVRTQRKVYFSMEKLQRLFEGSQDPSIVVYTPHMIILRSGIVEATLSRDGRMLIKKVSNESEAVQAANKILAIALKGTFKP